MLLLTSFSSSPLSPLPQECLEKDKRTRVEYEYEEGELPSTSTSTSALTSRCQLLISCPSYLTQASDPPGSWPPPGASHYTSGAPQDPPAAAAEEAEA